VPVALVPNAIAFRSPSYGLLATGWQSCADPRWHCRPQGTISLTTDGGRTWKVLLRTPRPVVSVSIHGRSEQAVFDDGETIASSDGGRHWAPVVVPIGGGEIGPCPAGTVSHSSGDWWLCTTQGSAGNMGKSVYRMTPNGPRRVANTPFAGRGHGGISGYGYPQGIAMAPDGFGLIWESRGTLYVTRDGGSHWTGLPKVARPEVDFGISANALREGVGFVVLAQGGSEVRRLIATADAGRSWHVVRRWS
jgi:photosystem II stability/assembly factor-like uncharacterized protein